MGIEAAILGPVLGAGIGVGGSAIAAGQAGRGGGNGNAGMPWWLGLALSYLNSEEQKRVIAEYERRQDVQNQDLLRIGQERIPEAMRLYDADAQQSLDAIQRGNADLLQRGANLPGEINRSRLEFLANLAGHTNSRQQDYEDDMSQFLGGMRGDEANILGGYQDRYKFAEEELEGYGQQQKSDIERMFENRSGAVAADLVNRGLASSTESAKQQLLNTELESGEQRRLAEDLTRNRINILGGIRGEESAARERLAGQRNQYGYGGMQAAYAQQSESDRIEAAYDAAMRGDALGARQALIGYTQQAAGNEANFYSTNAANRSGIYERGTGGLLDVLGSINYIPPPANNLSYQFGQNAAPVPQSASAWPSFFANALPQFGNFAGAAATSYFNRPPPPPPQYNPYYGPYPGFGANGGGNLPLPSPDWY